MRRLIVIAGGLAAAIVATPLVLTAVYGFVNPPSLAIWRHEAAGRRAVQEWVPLEAISPSLVRAVVMAEDARFCLHWGVDLNQLRIVLADTLGGEDPRGASTITMQTVKNLFLWPGRSYVRKAIEIPLAVAMDLLLSKERILEIYLNIAQWGPTAFGAEAAARGYFGIAAADLTREQALALATTLPAPVSRDPRRPGPRQRLVMRHVERELERAPWVFTCIEQVAREAALARREGRG
jgi:monofunctional biosynthetic peptidoglycan transglycosylase